MSNRLFQGIIHQMTEAADRTIGVIDDNGVIIACSELVKIGETRQEAKDELAYTSGSATIGGYTYRPINSGTKWEYIVFVEGEDKMADKLASILSISLSNIKNLYDEKYDRNSFIKNIILDNILPSDIYIKSKELRFNTEETRMARIQMGATKRITIENIFFQPNLPESSTSSITACGFMKKPTNRQVARAIMGIIMLFVRKSKKSRNCIPMTVTSLHAL